MDGWLRPSVHLHFLGICDTIKDVERVDKVER